MTISILLTPNKSDCINSPLSPHSVNCNKS